MCVGEQEMSDQQAMSNVDRQKIDAEISKLIAETAPILLPHTHSLSTVMYL